MSNLNLMLTINNTDYQILQTCDDEDTAKTRRLIVTFKFNFNNI